MLKKRAIINNIDDTYLSYGSICGIDEVGRGPMAGDVYAAAVILPRNIPSILRDELTDSKKLSDKKRKYLYSIIKDSCDIGLGIASVEEIDNHNILQATFIAMHKALLELSFKPNVILIDGNKIPPSIESDIVKSVIGGDSKSISIAAASVIAKVERDNYMQKIHEEFPKYNWQKNKGYGTKEHMQVILENGLTKYHRKSFKIKNTI